MSSSRDSHHSPTPEHRSARAVAVALTCLAGACGGGQGGADAQVEPGPPFLLWAIQGRSIDAADARSVARFDDGSSIVVGSFSGSIVFGEDGPNPVTLTSAGKSDLFIARFDTNGSLSWAKREGGQSDDAATSVAAYADGSAAVIGEYYGSVTFGQGDAGETTLPPGMYGSSRFVARYDADGALMWAIDSDAFGTQVAGAPGGAVIVAGAWGRAPNDTIVFGEGEATETHLLAAGRGDAFVARYEADGSFAWVRSADSPCSVPGSLECHNGATAVSTFADGSLVVTGYFEQVATFSKGEADEAQLVSAGAKDIFIAHYGADGSLTWLTRAGGTRDASGLAISAAADGSAMVAGVFRATTNFGVREPAQTTFFSAGAEDTFVAHYLADGSLDWVRQAGGLAGDWPVSIRLLADGSSLVTGWFGANDATFGAGEPGETLLAAGDSEESSFVARFDADGALTFAKRIGAMRVEEGTAFDDGGSIVCGSFSGSVTFGEGESEETTLSALPSAVAMSVFVARFGP